MDQNEVVRRRAQFGEKAVGRLDGKQVFLAGGAKGTAARHPVGPVEPEDVARLALYLASDESARTTGQAIAVDSGFSID